MSRRRLASARCARCKKIRKMYVRANAWYDWRISSTNVRGEGKVCWVCRIREIDPAWRPGRSMPEFEGSNVFRHTKKA